MEMEMNETERIKKIEELQYELFDLEEKKLYLLGQMQLFKNTGTKVCRKCKTERPIGMFYTDVRYKDDHRPHCAVCDSAMASARYRRKKIAA